MYTLLTFPNCAAPVDLYSKTPVVVIRNLLKRELIRLLENKDLYVDNSPFKIPAGLAYLIDVTENLIRSRGCQIENSILLDLRVTTGIPELLRQRIKS